MASTHTHGVRTGGPVSLFDPATGRSRDFTPDDDGVVWATAADAEHLLGVVTGATAVEPVDQGETSDEQTDSPDETASGRRRGRATS